MTTTVSTFAARRAVVPNRGGGDLGRRRFGRVLRRPVAILSVGVLLVLVLAALVGPVLVSSSPAAQVQGSELQPQSWAHPFGTDQLGRDLLSRTLEGLRVSLVAGVLATVSGGVLGVLIGFQAGYRGGASDTLLMRVIDGLIAFPTLLLGIALAAALGPGMRSIVVAIAVVQVPIFARLARAILLQEKAKEYVAAAVASGAGSLRVVFGHILRNALPVLLVQLALSMGLSVGIEAALSFLGIGIAPPEPSLGSILDASRGFLRDSLYFLLFPGTTLVLLLLGLNGLADTINEVLTPDHSRYTM